MIDAHKNFPFGYASHKMIYDGGGTPVDYIFLEVNDTFSRITGLEESDVIGKTARQVLPGIEKSSFDWIGFYGKIASSAGSSLFEQFSEQLQRWYQVQAYSNEYGFFSTVFTDITAIKQNAAELESFFSVNLDLLCIADIHGNFVKVNKEWSTVLGYSIQELQHHKFLDFVHQDDMNATLDAVQKLAEQNSVVNFVNRYRRKDGQYRYIEWRSHPNGTLIYAAARDITDRLLAEKKLKESEEQNKKAALFLRNTFEAITQPLVVIDVKTKTILMANEIAGGERITGKKCHQVFYNTSNPCINTERCCPIDDLINNKTSQILEHTYTDETGRSRCVEIHTYPMFDESGELTQMIEQRIDITERKESEMLLQSYTQLQEFLLSMSSRFINIPVENIDISVSSALENIGRFVNADRAYVFSYNWSAKTCTNTFEWCREGIESVINDMQNVDVSLFIEWPALQNEGKIIEIRNVETLPESGMKAILKEQLVKSLILIPMMSGGKFIGFTGFDCVYAFHTFTDEEKTLLQIFADMLTNVQNRRDLEKSLILAKEEADSANSAKSLFLANMSHEIRTPMNAVIGLSTILLESTLTKEQHDLMQKLHRASNMLLGIINDILDFSKIESGILELDIHHFTLESIISTVDVLFSDAAEKKGIAFSITVDEDIPPSYVGDSLRISQILTNLISNALKFTNKGSVSLSVTGGEHSTSVQELHFIVKDTGIGISEDKIDRIFIPFMQADTSTTRKYGGTGLGLPIARANAEAMGGRISIRSTENEGSQFTFTVRLPLALDDLKQHGTKANAAAQHGAKRSKIFSETPQTNTGNIDKPGSPYPTPDLSGFSILFVEDNTINQEVMYRFLKKLEHLFLQHQTVFMLLVLYRQKELISFLWIFKCPLWTDLNLHG